MVTIQFACCFLPLFFLWLLPSRADIEALQIRINSDDVPAVKGDEKKETKKKSKKEAKESAGETELIVKKNKRSGKAESSVKKRSLSSENDEAEIMEEH